MSDNEMRPRTIETLSWLDSYCLYREAGVNSYLAINMLNGDSELVLAQKQALASAAIAGTQRSQAVVNTIGDVVAGIGGAIMLIPGVGTIVGAVVAAIGFILKAIAAWFIVDCDKYHCQGYDRDNSVARKEYQRHIRALVGHYIPSGSTWYPKPEGDCRQRNHKCQLFKYIHDGLVIKGQNWRALKSNPSSIEPGPGDEQKAALSGCVRGVNALRTGGQEQGATEKLATIQGWQWINEDATPNTPEYYIKYGDDRKKPWTNKEDTLYYRAWRVRAILKWMAGKNDTYENILCRTMECMEEVLDETQPAGGESAGHQKRRRGSRWYASIIHMMQDIYEEGKKLGVDKFYGIFMSAGGFTEGGDQSKRFKEMFIEGKEFSPEEAPWPWYPLFERVSFWNMRKILIDLRPYMIYDMPSTGPLPVGEVARARDSRVKGLMVPVREPIIFSLDMMPIPAKLGRRGPSWPVIGLGVGAAAIGAYAIYKLLEPQEE